MYQKHEPAINSFDFVQYANAAPLVPQSRSESTFQQGSNQRSYPSYQEQPSSSLLIPAIGGGYLMPPERSRPRSEITDPIQRPTGFPINAQPTSSHRCSCHTSQSGPAYHDVDSSSRIQTGNHGFNGATNYNQDSNASINTQWAANMDTTTQIPTFAGSLSPQQALNPASSSRTSSNIARQPFESKDYADISIVPQDAMVGTTGIAAPSKRREARPDAVSVPKLACRCGPGCTCIACASHPYNSATQMRVEELTGIMNQDGYLFADPASGRQSIYGSDFRSEPDSQLSLEGFASFDEALQDRNTAGVGDYYDLMYNVSSGCRLGIGLCQCGSGCQCPGCLTHQGHDGP